MPRSRAQRKADTLGLLRTQVDCWVANVDEMGNAHLVPLSHYWDDAALVLATSRSSPTATNLLRGQGRRLLSGIIPASLAQATLLFLHSGALADRLMHCHRQLRFLRIQLRFGHRE